MKKKRKLKYKNIIIASFLIIISILSIKIYTDKNILKVIPINNLNIEINSNIKLSSLIKEIKNGKLLSDDQKIDTSKLGKQIINLLIKDKYGKEKNYEININVIDTTKPTLTHNKEIISYVGKEIDLLKEVSITDNSNEEINIKVIGIYDINTIGEYPLSYLATDSEGNQTTTNFTLKIIKDPNNYTFKTNKGFNAEVINGVTYIDGILIANKTYSLPNTFGSKLTTETQSAFNQMKADATILGLNLYISSGYRSYNDQKYIYNNYVKIDGQEKADTYSARAGHSEHQTGLAFDLNTINDSFTNTPEGKWIHDNCYKYGLILRYPKDKEQITGYQHESWHLRYIGIDLATKLYNNGNWITLEEYFGITSKYQS